MSTASEGVVVGRPQEDLPEQGEARFVDMKLLLPPLLLGVALPSLMQVVLGLAFSTLSADLGVGIDRVVLTVTWYNLMYTVSMPILAKLSDVFGRRLMFILGISIFGISTIACALAPSLEVLVVARAFQGLGGGGIFPVAIAIVGGSVPARKQGMALGVVSAGFGVAAVVGMIIAGPIVQNLSWHWLFWIVVPLAFLALILALRLPKEDVVRQSTSIDFLGAAVLVTILGTFILGMQELGQHAFIEPNVWPYFAVAVLAVPVFIMVETRAKNPILSLGQFKRLGISLANLIALTSGIGMLCVMIFIPTYFKNQFGLSSTEVSLAVIPLAVGMVIASAIAGMVLNKIGPKRPTVVGLFLLAAPLACLVFFLDTWSLWAILAALGVIGVGLGLQMAPINQIVLLLSPKSEHGQASSAVTMSRSIGGVVAGTVGGLIIANNASTIGSKVMATIQQFMPAGMPLPSGAMTAGSGSMASANLADMIKPMLEKVPATVRPMIEQKLPEMQAAADQVVRGVFVDAFQIIFLVGLGTATLAFLLGVILPRMRPKKAGEGESESAA